jgi:hypothetical protein
MDSVSLNKNVIVDLLLSVGFAALGERYIHVWPCSKKPVDVDWPQKARYRMAVAGYAEITNLAWGVR